MSNPFVRHHGFYTEVGDSVTVSDNITYLDVIEVMDSLNSFFPEDCCDLYSELLDKADGMDSPVTNVFKVLHDKMEEDGKEAIHRYDDYDDDEDDETDEDDEEDEDDEDDEEDDDEDYWFDGDSSIWDTLRMTVADVTRRFKAVAGTKLKFVDFYANKLTVSKKLDEEELRSIRAFIKDFVDDFHESDEYDEVANEFLRQDIEWADAAEIKDFLDEYVSTLNVLAFFESWMNDKDLDDAVKVSFSKCNFVDVVKEYLSNSELMKFVLYYDIGNYNDEFESKDFTLSSDMDKLYFHLKEVNSN